MKRDLPPERIVLLRPDDLEGLDEARVATLRSAFGANQVAEYPAKKAVELAKDVLSDAMVWFLTAVAIVFLIVGETADAVIPLLGYPLLYLPIHIVVLELLIHPAAILAFQRDPDGRWVDAEWQPHGFFGKGQKVAIGLAGLAITACVFGLFIASMQAGEAVDHARAMGIVCLIAALASLVAFLTRLREREAMAIFGCPVLLVIAIAAVPQVAGLLHLHVLDAADMALAVAAGVLGAAPSILFDSWNREGRRGNG